MVFDVVFYECGLHGRGPSPFLGGLFGRPSVDSSTRLRRLNSASPALIDCHGDSISASADDARPLGQTRARILTWSRRPGQPNSSTNRKQADQFASPSDTFPFLSRSCARYCLSISVPPLECSLFRSLARIDLQVATVNSTNDHDHHHKRRHRISFPLSLHTVGKRTSAPLGNRARELASPGHSLVHLVLAPANQLALGLQLRPVRVKMNERASESAH